MAYTLVSTVAGKLNDLLQGEVALLVDVTDDIEKLSRMFTLIQAVLKDAETRRSNNISVKTWLQNVKDVAYDVDDILDEWMTEDLRSQAANGGDVSCFSFLINCLLCPLTSFKHVLLRHKIGSRIKGVRGRLHDIAEEKNQLGLTADSGEGDRVVSELIRRGENREQTSSLVNTPSVIGREDEKNELLSLLLQEVTEVPFVISIVGMGGLGKTTLAQLIYNDEEVKGYMKMWVCVSEDFNVKQITKSIIESATKTGCESLDLDPLQDRLRCMLQAKKFLLVLDDVWSKDSEKWEKLRLPFQAGAPGSRIIVTTRSEDVAGRIMGRTGHMHKLAVLSDDDCWSLFESEALKHRSAQECRQLEEIGRKIVKKCGGVPLAAKTIGSVMQSRRTRSQWELVLRSKMWNSGDVFEGILPALLLSYYDLPPALRQCFAYCSVFPKDWEIEKDMIVKLWVAQGFISSINGSGDMEEIGELYFDDLLRRSLLQDAKINSDGSIEYCKMHDLVHDLAQYLAGSDCSVVEISKEASLNLNNVRHGFIDNNYEAGDEAISATLHKAHKLRTLLLRGSRISKVLDKLFHHSRRLRALDLSCTDIKKLPETVGQLKHLRYLDLSLTDIEELPEELSNCINLQTLRLNGCPKLRKLPRGMRKMISLRHLEFEFSHGLRYLPEGIGRLTELRTLTEFIVGGDDQGCKCGELKHLNHLQGRLPITGLQHVRSKDEAREAELHEKQHLHALSLKYDNEPLDDQVKRMEDVLESLRPHKNLKEIEIQNYKGSKLPKWIGDPIFSNLVSIELLYCLKCKQLPGLGKLPSLKFLSIRGMVEVKKVGGEFNGGGGVSFPKLEILSFYKMPNWEEWEMRGGDGEVMPSLLQLTINDCPKLKVLLNGMLSGGLLPVLPNLNSSEIDGIDERTSLPSDWLGQLRALQTLKISCCSQLKSLPKELGQLKALQTLEIRICHQLKSLPEELGQLKALRTLEIWNCPQLKSLPEELGQLKALQTLSINGCPQLNSLPELGQLKALQTLEISDCPQLNSLPEELGQLKALQNLMIDNCLRLKSLPEELGQLKALQNLMTDNCPQLKSLPEKLGQLKALQTLEICNCRQLNSLPEELGQLKALQNLMIDNCPQLKSLPEELGQLKALQTLKINNCPQLKSLPEELGQLKALQDLHIWNCSLLKERYQDGGVDHHKIAHVTFISIDSWTRRGGGEEINNSFS